MTGLLVTGLRHRFGAREVVSGLSLSVGPGELHCLLGPSGCGKTTTLRLIAGLEPVQQGSIAIAGETVAGPEGDLPPERRRVGLMFQDFALFPHLSARANVMFGMDGASAAKRRRADALLSRVGLSERASAYPATLSGGEQQRAALVRALATEPRLMLLDEPFSNLDAHLREQVRAQVVAILAEAGTPTVMVTHDPEEALRVATRVHVMQEGRITQSGTPAELYARPATPFVAGLFGPLNRVSGLVAEGRVETPFGPVPVPGLGDGDPVDVVLRPDALRLQPADGSAQAVMRVRTIRDTGPVHWLELDPADGPVFMARVPSSQPGPRGIGEAVGIAVDPSQIFVYPRLRGGMAPARSNGVAP
ncbi:ABC transporter ATP-binding protein [Marinivivus vitaminiproducens]|uniref:ABC transporter ATP-binding protein n=1 Tax=Marinivivus vitaminiproducens TaxID=3035935 RepID=UPI0027A4ECB4|nr:ABC transporter ATP-binding protein [Geminicoccaceae bacterium SCSIO 64248]